MNGDGVVHSPAPLSLGKSNLRALAARTALHALHAPFMLLSNLMSPKWNLMAAWSGMDLGRGKNGLPAYHLQTASGRTAEMTSFPLTCSGPDPQK